MQECQQHHLVSAPEKFRLAGNIVRTCCSSEAMVSGTLRSIIRSRCCYTATLMCILLLLSISAKCEKLVARKTPVRVVSPTDPTFPAAPATGTKRPRTGSISPRDGHELGALGILNRFPLLNRGRGKDVLFLPRATTDRPVVSGDGLTTGMWAVKLKFSYKDESRKLLDLSADMIAEKHGLENHGQIGELKGYYLFTRKGASHTWTTMASAVSSATDGTRWMDQPYQNTAEPFTPRPDDESVLERRGEKGKTELTEWNNTRRLLLNTQVEWQGHQVLLTRSKRGYVARVHDSNAKSMTRDQSNAHTSPQVPHNASSIYVKDEMDRTTSVPPQNITLSATKLTVSLSSARSADVSEEKARHEFYLNFANQYSRVSTVTHQRADVTQNPRYRDLVGASGGGSRRMGVGVEDDNESTGNNRSGTAHYRPQMAIFRDPLYYHQWHLENTADKDGIGDCNVTGVWKYGITGKGVVVAVVDDGVQWDHPDLIENYCPEGSFDLNANDDDPMPVRDDKEENKHGTRCAGEIAAVPNDHCGVGIAHGAKFSGIRILDGPLTDSMEAAAFNKHLDINDIYSCSWGPEDDGKTVDGPHPLAQAALKHGIVAGRQGYGSIYIVASGNGGHKGDNCNYDGYANSIYTITIGAVDEFGRVPSYAEECASMLACTFSSGAGTEDGNARKIVTTDWTLGKNKKRISGCTESHTGTSAATPLAAGMVALMLQARPCLTWRDIQHIIVMTSLKIGPDGEEWTTNTAGFHHSDKKGFGLLNAWRLVNAARVWTLVPWLTSVTFECPDRRRVIPNTKKRALIVKTLVTKAQCHQNMVYSLEQVLVTVDIDHPRRGDLFITLVCPSGTTSVVGRPRKNDDSSSGLWNWSFTTVKCWGEQPHGTYRLIIHDTVDRPRAFMGELRSWKLLLYGSTITQSDVDFQRKRVEEAMSGKYLMSFGQYNSPALDSDEQSNATSSYDDVNIGYCPPLRKNSYRRMLMLEKSPTERTLKLIGLSGFFLLLWGVYCLFDMAKLGPATKDMAVGVGYEHLQTSATKLGEFKPSTKQACSVHQKPNSVPSDVG